MMKSKMLFAVFVFIVAFTGELNAQNDYRYAVDLNRVASDTLDVELMAPKLQQSVLTFCFPKIIPGTYAISDYGKFVSNVKAFDKTGKSLPVKKLSENKWKITNAAGIVRLTYKLTDIFDSDIKHSIYPMAATNFEAGSNFVVHTPGFFGFFEGYNRLPFTISIAKPANLYGSTSLTPTEQTPVKDVFNVANVDELYDSPIMYTVPDTTTLTVGNCKVLVSVYSPGKKCAVETSS